MTNSSDGDRGASIAIVDDDQAIRQMLALRLGMVPGVRVAGEGANGREAIGLAAMDAPDLMVLDLRMPVMGGADAIPVLRVIAPRMRIVVHSSLTGEVDLTGPRRPDAAIKKDGNLAPLVSVVTALLDEVRADRDRVGVGVLASAAGF